MPESPALLWRSTLRCYMPTSSFGNTTVSAYLIHALLLHPAGLTSPGAKMEDVGAESAVAIMAEDKQHALGIGLTKMSTQDMYDEEPCGLPRLSTRCPF